MCSFRFPSGNEVEIDSKEKRLTISIHHFREPATESLDGRFTLAKSVELVQAILALVEDHFYSE